MANELSDYGENGLLDHVFKNTAFPFAAQVRYFGISRADPGDDGSTNNEPTGEGSYARVQILGTEWNAASGRQITNNIDKSFPQVTVQITGATHWTFWDASTAGNYLGKAAIPGAPVNFEVDSIPTIESSTFIIGWQSGGLSNYLANATLEHFVLKTEYTQPLNIYAALSEGNPGDDFSGIAEPSTNGYARAIANSWDAAASGATQNSTVIQFPKATGDWRSGNNLTHIALFDAITGGNGLAYNALTSAVAINANERPQFPVGDLDVTMN